MDPHVLLMYLVPSVWIYSAESSDDNEEPGGSKLWRLVCSAVSQRYGMDRVEREKGWRSRSLPVWRVQMPRGKGIDHRETPQTQLGCINCCESQLGWADEALHTPTQPFAVGLVPTNSWGKFQVGERIKPPISSPAEDSASSADNNPRQSISMIS